MSLMHNSKLNTHNSPGQPRRAILVMAYGGPNALDDVEPYLLDVRGGRPTSPELIEEIRERYAHIGGRSPLLEITRAQAQALEERLNADAGQPIYRAYVGMRHWFPYIREAVAEIVAGGMSNIVALCMAPHYSRMSIGAYFRKVQEAQAEVGVPLNVTYVESWHNHPLYISAIAEKVEAALARFPSADRERVKVVFTAHSLPASIVEQGDPYDAQLRETARLAAARLDLPAETWQFCYQSAAAGSVKWLGPAIEDVVVELASSGHKQILVAPIGFVADHVEVLYDIDVVCQDLARAHDARLERTESQNTSPAFIAALADVVAQAVRR